VYSKIEYTGLTKPQKMDELDSLTPWFKRGPYKNYQHKGPEIDKVLNILQTSEERGIIRKISDRIKVPQTTLYEWRDRLRDNPEFKPYQPNRSTPHLHLPLEIENQIANYFRVNFVDRGFLITFEQAQKLALTFLSNLVISQQLNMQFLNHPFSRTWFQGFLDRQRLTFRKVRPSKRPPVTEDQINQFKYHVLEAIHDYGNSAVINMDETRWLVNPQFERTLAEVGAETVHGYSEGDPKADFSVIASISADGSKLPLWIIAKGKSSRCEVSYGTIPDPHKIVHTISGWINDLIMIKYCKWLRKLQDKKPFVLITDCYGAHTTRLVLEYCMRKNIKLIVVPPGGTSLLQPLDRYVFGVLKIKGKTRRTSYYHQTMGGSPTRAESAGFLLESWDELTFDLILKAWDLDDPQIDGIPSDEEEIDDYHYPTEPPSSEI
jgi:hypothetical protein